nr:hypothetical protein GCM10010200_100660 [Actinomadura rugatobispora]
MNVALDGYIAAIGDDIGWSGGEEPDSSPSDELFQWWYDQMRASDLSLYGRKRWETMSSHWPTGDQQPNATPAEIEFARLWRDMPKVVFHRRSTRSTGTPVWSPRSPGSGSRTAARWTSAARRSPGRPCGPG